MLEVKNLYKEYGKFTALNGLNMCVPEGEIFGFIGPNGAGKTTTMKIISGLLKETSGEIYIDDINALKNNRKIKELIGYMPDFFGVYDNLKTYEYLEFYASIYDVDSKESKKICDDLLELVDLTDKKNFYVDSLSRGMKQRLCLARSLVHNPKFLILDEPASGLDPRARFQMKEILKTLKDMGKTIIISSHILSELSEICTSMGIIDKGKMVVSGTAEQIMTKVYSSRIIKIKLADKIKEASLLLKEMPVVNNIAEDNNTLEAAIKGGEDDMIDILKKLVNNNIPVITFKEDSGNLEDVFMKVTKGDDKNEG